MAASVEQELWQIVQAVNDAWMHGRPEELAPFFHENMVIVAPGFAQRIEGRAACIESYRDFVTRATLRDLRVEDHVIDVFGDTAVVTYAYHIAYDLEGQSLEEGGRDVFVFGRQDGRWLVMWRTLVPS